jgi:hypothetical protein
MRIVSFLMGKRNHSLPGWSTVTPSRIGLASDALAGKLKAWSAPERRPSKRIKDLGDIARLVEAHPHLEAALPEPARAALAAGA